MLLNYKNIYESWQTISFPEKDKWENTLRRVATLFREPRFAPYIQKSLKEFLSADEIIEKIHLYEEIPISLRIKEVRDSLTIYLK